jgi:hypothetical protein
MAQREHLIPHPSDDERILAWARRHDAAAGNDGEIESDH